MIETQQRRLRSEIPVEYTWDVTLVYPDDAAWEVAMAEVEAMGPELRALEGSIGTDAASLLHALQTVDRAGMQLQRVHVYARMRKDSDTTDTAAQAQESRASSLAARIGAAASFLEPEILAIPPDTVSRWVEEEPDLAPYAYFLRHLSRLRPHVRSAEVEAVMAQFSDVTRAPEDTYDALTNADLKFPSVEDEHGRPVELSHARYFTLMRNPDRRVRRDACVAFFDTFRNVRTTVGTTLGATVRNHVLNARLRGYPSALVASLEPNDIPLDVYHTLISTVHANLTPFHRYISLRKRILALDEVRLYDIYAPLVPNVQTVFPYGTGKELVRTSLAPLGHAYAQGLDRILDRRWIDVYESVGKQSGAYSGGAYTTPPFILLNYEDQLTDVYVLAHELGHSLHSYFTCRTQPFVSGNYTMFLAEVASTVNESLLTAHLLATTQDPEMRRHLIVEQLEGLRGTLFRQTWFAEFELAMHEHVEAGEALTSDWLSDRYREIASAYYGPEFAADDQLAIEWAFIPHFYLNFYVYQYATGKSAALALAAQILEEGEPAVQRYLTFLSSGSSRPSIDILRDAGVDMATPAPIQSAINQFEGMVHELEELSR